MSRQQPPLDPGSPTGNAREGPPRLDSGAPSVAETSSPGGESTPVPGSAGPPFGGVKDGLSGALVGVIFGAFLGGALCWADPRNGTGGVVGHGAAGALIGAVAGWLYGLVVWPLRRPVYTARREALTAAATRQRAGDALAASLKRSWVDIRWSALKTGLQFGAVGALLVWLFKGGASWVAVAAAAGFLLGGLLGAAGALAADAASGLLVWGWARVIAGRPAVGAVSGAACGALYGGWCGWQVFGQRSAAGAVAGSFVFAACFGLIVGYFGFYLATRMQGGRSPAAPDKPDNTHSAAAGQATGAPPQDSPHSGPEAFHERQTR